MDFDQFAESLATEALSEAADNYFGSRKRLELRLEHVAQLTERLREKEEAVVHKGCFLNYLLRRGWAVEGFYRAIGVDPERFSFFSRCETSWSFDKAPFAYTARGKYIKFVLEAYRVFQEASNEFMNGAVRPDREDPRRKRVTLHYTQVLELAERTHKRVMDMNSSSGPVCALQYMKSLDPNEQNREKVTGATLSGYACSLDEGMAFTPPNLESLRAMAMPDLPGVDTVTREITAFCKQIHAKYKDEINALMSGSKPADEED